jgi:hypothetical protein
MKPNTDDLLDYILARLREGPRLTQEQIKRMKKYSIIEVLFSNLKSMLIIS